MSARAISRWLKEAKGIKLSDVSIAKALRDPGKYWTMVPAPPESNTITTAPTKKIKTIQKRNKV